MVRYAEPLLIERAYVAERAAQVEISRSRGGTSLHQSVCQRLNVDPDANELIWDSYRNHRGRWVVTAFHDGADVGTWLYEENGRTVHPLDESARALMGAGPSVVVRSDARSQNAATPPSRAARSYAQQMRNQEVPAREPLQPAPQASPQTQPRPAASSSPTRGSSSAGTEGNIHNRDAVAEKRQSDPTDPSYFDSRAHPDSSPAAADRSGSTRPGRDAADSAEQESLHENSDDSQEWPSWEGFADQDDGLFEEPSSEHLIEDHVAPEPSNAQRPKRNKRHKGKRGRASLPSWDEIVFGASKGGE